MALFSQVKLNGLDAVKDITDDAYLQTVRSFLREIMPAQAGIYIRKLDEKPNSPMHIYISLTSSAWTDELVTTLSNIMACAGVPETSEDATFQLTDEQTGQVYQTSIQRHNNAGISIVVPGFAHATDINDTQCVAWLEAYDGKLMFRTYNNPDDDGPDQSIKLISTVGYDYGK